MITLIDKKFASMKSGIISHPWNGDYEFLSISILSENKSVVIVALDRPEKRNAINTKVRWVNVEKTLNEMRQCLLTNHFFHYINIHTHNAHTHIRTFTTIS
jgi:hypothetical protein